MIILDKLIRYLANKRNAAHTQNNILYAPPVIRDGRLYRGVAATDNPRLLIPEIMREKWVIIYMKHGAACPPYHPSVDIYQADRSFHPPSPSLHITGRDFTDPAIFRPTGIAKQYDVIFNSTWLQVKRPMLMLRTLQYARDHGRPISCLWFGYHWNRHGQGLALEQEIKSLAARLQLPVTFEAPNFDPEVINQRFNSARVGVLCSRQEGGPRVMSEAMLAGLPYITTRDTRGGSPAFVNDRNGRLCAPTPRSLAEAIWYVLDHLDSYQPRAWALEHMCLPVAFDRIKQVLDQLAEQKGWLVNREISFTGIDWSGRKRAVQQADAACVLS